VSASADTKIQVNFKIPGSNNYDGTLINVYASNERELAEQLDSLAELAGKIGEVDQILRAVGTVVNTPAAAPRQASTPAAAPSTGDGPPVCQHGVMERKETTRKSGPNAGKRAVDFHCPQPKDAPDKCPSIWGKAF
jgi:hypothetical protein